MPYTLRFRRYVKLCWFQTSLPLAATPRDHYLLFHGLQLSVVMLPNHRSWVELKSTVCNLPCWAKRQGYRFIGKMLLAARSYTNTSSKWQCDEWQTSLKAALHIHYYMYHSYILVHWLVKSRSHDPNTHYSAGKYFQSINSTSKL